VTLSVGETADLMSTVTMNPSFLEVCHILTFKLLRYNLLKHVLHYNYIL
jgi:hypothetical protein